ncbi:DUF6883 domain-containing protein [Anthocerotibacter panamensis]|uniref:DUF6883 domain-containing protein n=1 Tax=Anthocerotibacter panamensis TaxID=2857077 RepID=UPI0036F22EFB
MIPKHLPNSSNAYVEERKILAYLLDLKHSSGASKAKFFLNRGFDRENWQYFSEALIFQGTNNPVKKVKETEYGTRYTIECHCPTPDRLNPCIRTVWELREGETQPRLITAFPEFTNNHPRPHENS